MAVELFANLALTTVSSGGTTAPAPGTTESWTVASSSTFPAAVSGVSQFHIQEDDPTKQSEIILVTNVSGTTWSVTRGVEGTTPVAHTAGFTVIQTVTNSWLSTVRTTAVPLTAADIGAGTFPAGANTFQGNVNVQGVIWGQSSTGVGDVLKVGNDATIVDINASHAFGIQSQTDTTRGGVQFGTTGPILLSSGTALALTGSLTVSSTLGVTGAVTLSGNAAGVTDGTWFGWDTSSPPRMGFSKKAAQYPKLAYGGSSANFVITEYVGQASIDPANTQTDRLTIASGGAVTLTSSLAIAGALTGVTTLNTSSTLSENGNRVYSAGNAPPYPVTSVATRTGAVTLTAADIGAGTFPGAAYAFTGAVTVPSGMVVGTTNTTNFIINGSAGFARKVTFQAAGVDRFRIGLNGVTESGSNTGSDLLIQANDDAGTNLGAYVTITRATGAVAVTGSVATGALTVTGAITTTSTITENGNRVYSAGNAPPYPVTSVASRTGAVTLTAADIAAGTFTGFFTFTSSLTATGITMSGNLNMTASSAGIEIGAVGTSNSPYIDFHSGATGTDWDARLQATGGTGASGGGTLTLNAAAWITEGVVHKAVSSANSVLSVAYNGATADNNSYGIVGITAPASVNQAYYSMTAAGNAVFGMGIGSDNVMRIGAVTTSKAMGANVVKIDSSAGITTPGGGSFGGALAVTGAITEGGNHVYSASNANLASATPAAVASAGAVGAGTDFARGNHVHAGVATLTGTAGQIGVSASTGAVTLTNLGVTSIVAGTNISISGATGAVTINASGGGAVSSVAGRTGAVTLTAADIAPGTFSASGQYVFPNGTWVAVQGVALDLSSANGTTGALGAGVGDKLALYGTSFGFGVQSNRLVAYLPSTASFAVRQNSLSGNASSGTEVFTVSGTGAVGASGLITASAGVSVPSGQPFTVGPKKTYSGTLALPATTGTATVLGQFSSTAGAMALRLHLHLVTGSVTRTKTYEVVVDTATDSTNTYYKLLPADQSTAQSAGNDVALEIYRPSTATTTWQIWVRNSATVFASTGALTWSAESYGDAVVTYAAALSPATGASGGAVSTLHPSNALDTVAGNVGIGTDTPGALLDVRGTLALTGDQTITKNAAKIALTDGTRNAVVGLATATNDIATSSVAGDLVLGSGTSPAYGGRVFVPGSVAVGGTMNAVGDLQVLGVSQPRGVIARATPITANTTLGAAGAEITLITLNANVIAGRKYRVVALYPSVTSTVAADDIVVRIYAGATLMQNSGRIRITAAALGFSGGPVEATYSAASTVTGTFTLRMIRVAGTGTGTANAGATTPIEFYVEDVGTV